MEDEFLKAFNEQRRLRLERDRTFEIEGAKLRYRPSIAPEVPLALQAVTDAMARWGEEVGRLVENTNGTLPELPEQPYDNEAILQAWDDVVRACLDPDSHPVWEQLRDAHAEFPFTADDITALALYLIGKTTQLPTDGPQDSSDTRPEILTTSPGSSPSRARKRKTSAPS